jgi:ankyrin repeat protein
MLYREADVNARNKSNRTPLMRAACRGDKDIVALLIAGGANVFLQDTSGKTALDWARLSHHEDTIAIISNATTTALVKEVRAGIDVAGFGTAVSVISFFLPTVRHTQEETVRAEALMTLRRDVLAVNDEHIARLKDALRTRGPTIPAILAMLKLCTLTRAQFDEATAALGSAPARRVGAASGADTTKRRVVPLLGKKTWEDGDPALPALRHKWSTEPLYYLDAEELGFTALIKAAVEAEPEALQRLIHSGATVDLETSKGFTALSWACIMGHRDIVFVLLKNDAIIDYPSASEGKTPLMQAAANGRVECVILLLQTIFDRASHACHLRRIEAESKSFRTEIERFEFLSVDWVDEYECALVRKDKRGRTALDHAMLAGSLDAVQALQAAYQRYVMMLCGVEKPAWVMGAWLLQRNA